MSAKKKLSTVANDIVESYGNTTKNIIHAYRAGGERVAGAIEKGWNRAMQESRSQLGAGVERNATAVQQTLHGYYMKGLTLTSNGANGAVNQMVKLAGAGVDRVAANASLFEEKTGVSALNSLAQASLPGAVALCTLAEKIEQKSAALVSKIEGGKVAARSVRTRRAPAVARRPRKVKAA